MLAKNTISNWLLKLLNLEKGTTNKKREVWLTKGEKVWLAKKKI